MKLINLNKASNDDDELVVMKYAKLARDKFKDNLIGAELGSCYGGNVEEIATEWGSAGKFYGYDTFKGHPKHLAPSLTDFEATCMDYWYKPDVFGTAALSYEYQRRALDELGLTNAYLVEGEVNEHSCDDLDHINFAFLDMDLHVSMANGFEAVKDKIVKGGYLLLHDVVDKDHIPLTHQWYNETVLTDPNYKLLSDNEDDGEEHAVGGGCLKAVRPRALGGWAVERPAASDELQLIAGEGGWCRVRLGAPSRPSHTRGQ